MTSLYIVGELLPGHPEAWQFVGVFDNEKDAMEACLTPHFFVGPVVLNKSFSGINQPWPEAYCPLSPEKAIDAYHV